MKAGGGEGMRVTLVPMSTSLTTGDPKESRSPGNAVSKLISQLFFFLLFKHIDICHATYDFPANRLWFSENYVVDALILKGKFNQVPC